MWAQTRLAKHEAAPSERRDRGDMEMETSSRELEPVSPEEKPEGRDDDPAAVVAREDSGASGGDSSAPDPEAYPALCVSTSELLRMTVQDLNQRRCCGRIDEAYEEYLTETVGAVLVDFGCFDGVSVWCMLMDGGDAFRDVRSQTAADVRVPRGYWKAMQRLLGA